jgi:hypothetical protein
MDTISGLASAKAVLPTVSAREVRWTVSLAHPDSRPVLAARLWRMEHLRFNGLHIPDQYCAKRNPLLLLRLVGSLLLRSAERQLLVLLFQDPPRSTRTESRPSHPAFAGDCKFGHFSLTLKNNSHFSKFFSAFGECLSTERNRKKGKRVKAPSVQSCAKRNPK